MTEILNYSPGIVARLIGDAITIGVAYALSFVGCDLIYNDFSLSQSIKSAYWFFLGPFLWRWGTAVPWVFDILKNFVEGKWTSIKGKFLDWAEGELPSWMLTVMPPSIIADMIDDNGDDMIDNYQYIQEKRFQDMKQPSSD
jgi:hypothetical protein